MASPLSIAFDAYVALSLKDNYHRRDPEEIRPMSRAVSGDPYRQNNTGSNAMHTIGQIGKRFGLPRSTLLYYDAIGLLSPSRRSDANYF